jgi:exopolysaccharide biosynthesis polyprenyl glycosylphosphotransferase
MNFTTEFSYEKLCHRMTRETQSGLLSVMEWVLKKSSRTSIIIILLDVAAMTLGMTSVYLLADKVLIIRKGNLYDYLPMWSSYMLFFLLIMYFKDGYYRFRRRRPDEELELVFKANWWALLLTITIHFIFYKHILFSRYVFILGLLASFLLTLLGHFGLRVTLRRLWSLGIGRENLLIVGNSVKDIKNFCEHLKVTEFLWCNVLGYVADQPFSHPEININYLGGFDNIRKIHKTMGIDSALLAMKNDTSSETVCHRVDYFASEKISTLMVSKTFNNFNFGLTRDGYSGIFEVYHRSIRYLKPLNRFSKRAFDLLITPILLLPALPIGVILALWIKFYDGGPIFFKHRLVGKDGEVFDLLKFRTMVPNAQEILRNNPEMQREFLKNYKLKNDPRLTPIGRWLRKYSLDELPQFINILKGDMSIIGPRPVREKELDLFGDFKHERVRMLPGLTGLWQVSGRCNTTYEDRIEMDKFYYFNYSLWMDIFIFLKTPLKVLKGEGAV